MLERILYVSRAASGTELADVFEIGQALRRGNAETGLSGALVFVDGWLVQALEGPAPALCAAYARALKDPRQVQISLRSRESIQARLFPEAVGLILRTGSSLNPAVLGAFNYSFGFPVEKFPAGVLLDFLTETCRPVGLPVGDPATGAAKEAGLWREA